MAFRLVVNYRPRGDQENAIQYAGTSVYLGIAGIMFACLFCDGNLTRLLILRRAYILAALIATAAGYLGFFHLIPGYQIFLDNDRVSATFKDPNVYGPFLIFPLLAALTTLIQSRMLQMPPPVNPTEQELQTLQMQRTMVWLSPLMIGYFALNVPAGLGLYWFVGNCVSIIQQSFVVGWGNVLPARFRRAVVGGSDARGGAPPAKGPGGGSKRPPNSGAGPKRPKRQT